jgi:hypothetical protein
MAIDKARHAFGNSANLQSALNSGAIDAYDILFLDGDTEPKVGWVDKNGIIRLVEDKIQIARVEELPVANGDENVVYIYNNEGYIWDAVNSQCVPMSKSADLTALETQVSSLETQINNKVDTDSVQSMIDVAVEEAVEKATFVEVVEF